MNMVTPFFSIIIPVYNAAKYLRKTLDSIGAQDYSSFEVILIDDGSTDCSTEIAQEYCNKDNRFHLYCQTNAGVSKARNAGIRYAKGCYVLFIDSDDEITSEMLSFIRKKLDEKKADLILWSYVHIDEKSDELSDTHIELKEQYYDKKMYLKNIWSCPVSHSVGVVWNRVFNLSIIRNNHITFPEDISLGEDFIFNMNYLLYIDTIQSFEKPLYRYRCNVENSLCTKKKALQEFIFERTKMYEAYRNLYIHENLDKKWVFFMHFFIIKTYFDELDNHTISGEISNKALYHVFVKANGIRFSEFSFYYLMKKIVKITKLILHRV